MRVKKTCEVGGILLEMTQENGQRTLTLGTTNVPLEEVRELVEWLQTEVLSTSANPTLLSYPVGVRTPGASNLVQTAVQQFPALETRLSTAGKLKSDGIPVVESAIKPGEIDPFEGRKVNAEQKGKYKALTSIPLVDLRGVEQAQGYVETPIRVKV